MNRPQSAKPGYRGNWGQGSVEDLNEQNNSQKNPNRRQIKIMKPDLTAHDFGRILPRKIQQDKQRLYSEALQLKQNLNEITQENIRLKTKISILEREKDKINKFIDTAPEGLGSKGSRINIYQSRSHQKENMIIKNLKKIVRQSREQNDSLQTENQKIKRMMKYTKINEIEIERKIIIDENKRLNTLLEEYSSQIIDQVQVQKQNAELKRYLQQQLEEKQQIGQEKERLEQLVESLEGKLKSEAERYQNKQKKLLRQLNSQKRKVQQVQKRYEQISKQLRSIKQNQQKIVPKQLIKPIKNTKTIESLKNHDQKSDQSQQWIQKYNQIKCQNDILLKRLEETNEKLKNAENQLTQYEDKNKNIQLQLSEKKVKQAAISPPQNKPESLYQQQQEEEKQDQPNENNQDQYEQSFEKEEPKPQLKEQSNHIEKYKKDFQENEQQEEIYKKQQESESKKMKFSEKSEAKKENKTNSYKPNKKALAEIKQLLTYRMKAQRYPFKDIQVDIEAAETSEFAYADLCNMLVNEPFYLISEYTKVFLSYCYEKQKIEATDLIKNTVLISKLRKVVDEFELLPQQEEKEMIIRIAQMTSTYPRQLQVAFENIKNGEQTVSRKDLIEMFRKLELQDKYIELIIAQLSLCSDDLEHLNFHGFFERFYMEDENQDQYLNNHAIEEEQSQQSYKNSSRVKKSARTNKNNDESQKPGKIVSNHI